MGVARVRVERRSGLERLYEVNKDLRDANHPRSHYAVPAAAAWDALVGIKSVMFVPPMFSTLGHHYATLFLLTQP